LACLIDSLAAFFANKIRITPENTKCHIFINHWPSKRGGSQASASRRKAAAAVLAQTVDSVLKVTPSADVIVTGDFNDTPENVAPLLCAPLSGLKPVALTKTSELRTVEPKTRQDIAGTIKYRGNWEQIDQFFVSHWAHMMIFAPEFLLEPDTQFTGVRPRRTHLGPRWHAGLSDHLPIILLTVAK